MSTPYHAKYFAHGLTDRCSVDSLEKLAGAVAGVQVDPTASDADKLLTKQLVLVATTAHIKFVDYLIVTANRIFSFRKQGLL